MSSTAFDNTLGSLGIKRSDDVTKAMANAQGKSTMGQADFLALMTAQLKNQDPFNPTDNTQMVSQMAQFSSLSGQEETNSTLKAIAAKLGATSASDALGWVGKNVLVEGKTAYPQTSGALDAAVELDHDASDVRVAIRGANGETLQTVSLGAQKAGTVNFTWDGTTEDGQPAGPGPFTIDATAVDGNTAVTSRTLVWAPVTSVQLTADGDPKLTVPGLGQVSSSAVRSVG